MENVLRTPWRAEENSYYGLWDVIDCDGKKIAWNKTEKVARLIAVAPELNLACLAATEQVQALRDAVSTLESILYTILEPISLELDWSPSERRLT